VNSIQEVATGLNTQAAGGTLPNTPLPTALPTDAVQTLQVIAYNEIFEVAFFSSLLANITNGVEGFTDLPLDKDYITSILTAVVAVSRSVPMQNPSNHNTDDKNSKKSFMRREPTLS
jgi:hypothetical protein